MLFKLEEFENAGFRVDRKYFKTELFENNRVTISM